MIHITFRTQMYGLITYRIYKIASAEELYKMQIVSVIFAVSQSHNFQIVIHFAISVFGTQRYNRDRESYKFLSTYYYAQTLSQS